MIGWMIGWTVILVSNVFVFPKATCELCWTGVQCPNASFLDSIQCAAILHAQTVQRPCCCNKQTNKQTNGCTWVDENPQAFLPFFLSYFLSCLLACLLQDAKHLLTNFASVSAVPSCSQPRPPASHGCKIGGSYSTPMAHNWIACRACH